MSATDDARADLRSADRSRTARLSSAPLLVAGFLAGATLAVAGLLIPEALPDLPRFESRMPWPADSAVPALDPGSGISLQRDSAGSLALRGAEPVALRALAGSLARASARQSRIRTLRASARLGWQRALAPEPLPPLAAEAECAVRLRGRAEVARALSAGAAAAAARAVPAPPEVRAAGEALAAADVAIERAALTVDAVALEGALAAANRAESAWLLALSRAPGSAGAEAVEASWRERERADAQTLDDEAARIEAGLTPLQHELVAARVPEFALIQEHGVPDPEPALVAAAGRTLAPARPIAEVWALAALAGGLIGTGASLLLGPRARRVPREAASPVRRVRPAEVAARLHVLSGADERRVAAGAAKLAATFLERGERVLVMDAGRRLRLHEYLGGDPRWGVSECMAGEMPVLGTVQNLGGTGLYLLARGQVSGAERWSRLGRLLDEARPHFGQIILALDAAAPHSAGQALRGFLLEGWWAGTGEKLPRVAEALAERMGIHFHGLELKVSLQDALEALSGFSVASAAPSEPPTVTAAQAPAEPVKSAVPEPAVLDCDLQVRERLRFLLWMKGIQAEGRRAASPAPAESGAALEH